MNKKNKPNMTKLPATPTPAAIAGLVNASFEAAMVSFDAGAAVTKVGKLVGIAVGDDVSVDGLDVGDSVLEIFTVGVRVGERLGFRVVGLLVAFVVGCGVDFTVGFPVVGFEVSCKVGFEVGALLGQTQL
jgi:hypothetical protein